MGWRWHLSAIPLEEINQENFGYREHDKKVCILGLASLLTVPTAAMPPELQAGLDQVFRALLKLLKAYKDQRAGLFFLDNMHILLTTSVSVWKSHMVQFHSIYS